MFYLRIQGIADFSMKSIWSNALTLGAAIGFAKQLTFCLLAKSHILKPFSGIIKLIEYISYG